ncbi:hypothetical protein E4T56_gene13446 [Termitomyces sp. T112]|nr:hypothetical protein E4T56_gene13446 [Termitomyces sp. T112]
MAEEAAPETAKKRPRLELDGGRERKRGKSMFGLVIGTLNKAKIEDRERSASEAAKKRHLIEQRLQTKLRKETDSVRRAEEAKKDKMTANRKEEELQLKDSIYKFRRSHLPLYANFLLTSDIIPDDEPLSDADADADAPNPNVLAHPPRTHPPPLYYLPALLLPAQQSFLARRKRAVHAASNREYALFREERARGVEDVNKLRQRVADEEAKKTGGAGEGEGEGGGGGEGGGVRSAGIGNEASIDEKVDADAEMGGPTSASASVPEPEPAPIPTSNPDTAHSNTMEMDVDDELKTPASASVPEPASVPEAEPRSEHQPAQEEKKEEPLGGDEDEAVEY